MLGIVALRKPQRSDDKKGVIYATICLSIILSNSFETVGRTLVGLKLVLEWDGPFLGRGVISAHFSSSGEDEFSMQSLKICVKGSNIYIRI